MSSPNPFMQRAIQLAGRGRGYTKTNPVVGAVIAVDENIIGEGYHRGYGMPHAEIEAIRSVSNDQRPLFQKSTLYVTLEPCSHYGKTPPCAEAIIKHEIPRVCIGVKDPFPMVSGRGIQMLRDAGIEVVLGIEKEDCEQLLHRFSAQTEQGRPFVHLKWAQSKDGYLGRRNEQTPISREDTKLLVHRLRSMNDAILVGTNTLLTDNPSLSNRLYPGPSPTKLILDRKGVIKNKAFNFFKSKGRVIGILASDTGTSELYDDVILLPSTLEPGHQLSYILEECLKLNIASVFVEGGSILLREFIADGLWDRADIIRSAKILNEGIPAPVLSGKKTGVKYSGDDEVITLFPMPKR